MLEEVIPSLHEVPKGFIDGADRMVAETNIALAVEYWDIDAPELHWFGSYAGMAPDFYGISTPYTVPPKIWLRQGMGPERTKHTALHEVYHVAYAAHGFPRRTGAAAEEEEREADTFADKFTGLYRDSKSPEYARRMAELAATAPARRPVRDDSKNWWGD